MILEKIAKKPVASIERTATIEQVARVMRDMHVGDVVITERKGGRQVPVGILTDRDIVVSGIALGLDARAFRADDLMSSSLVTAQINDSLYHVINLMKEEGCRRIPILDDRGSLVGIVSLNDVMSLLADELNAVVSIPQRQQETETRRRVKMA